MQQPMTVHLDAATVTKLEYLRRVKNQQIGLSPDDQSFFNLPALARFCVQVCYDMQAQKVASAAMQSKEGGE